MNKLLFICTGNTCRSSMAEGLAKKIFNELKISDWQIDSAGTFALNGQQANPKAIELTKEYNIDLTRHKSKSLPLNIDDYDLILTMTKSHKNYLESFCDVEKEKVFTLNEFANGSPKDILDPFGKNIKVYRETFNQLEKAIKKVANIIKK